MLIRSSTRSRSPYASPSWGRCIYCGYAPTEIKELTDEHIMPRGLGGKHYMENASCKKCQEITRDFEQSICRWHLWPTRHFLGIKSKKKSDIPTHFNVMTTAGRVVKIPVDDHPHITSLPVFKSSGIFPDVSLGSGYPHYRLVHSRFQKDFKRRIRKAREIAGEDIVQYSRFSVSDFCRMLCKIAHSHVAAGYDGSNEITQYLPDVIRGISNDCSNIVLSADPHAIPSRGNRMYSVFDQMIESDGVFYIIVFIRIFEFSGAPVYMVFYGHGNSEYIRSISRPINL